MDPVRRRELTRFAAPAAFLAGVTVAVLLVKAGLDNDSPSQTVVQPTSTARTTTRAATTRKIVLTTPPATATTATTTGGKYYVIQAGDTLGEIAAKYNTTVDELLTLNPGVDPNALHPGDRIRVG